MLKFAVMTGSFDRDTICESDPHAYHLTRAADALGRIPAVMAQIDGVPSDDPQRREALRQLRSELVAARDPLLPHVRGAGRLYGSRGDPVREFHAQLRASIRRVDSRLNPTSGSRRRGTPAALTSRASSASSTTPRAAARAGYQSMLGTLNQAKGALKAAELEFATLRRVVGAGEPYKGMATFREESRALIEPLTTARRRLRDRLDAYVELVAELRRERDRAYAAGRATARKHADFLRHEDNLSVLAREVEAFSVASRSFEAQLYRASRRTRPFRSRVERRPAAPQLRPARTRSDWRHGSALHAVAAFRSRSGRLPTKRECNTLAELPPYTTLYREFGARPFEQIARICNDDHATSEE